MHEAPLYFAGALILVVIFRVLAGGMDQDRVRAYLEERGEKLISAGWAPFGKGWFGEKSDRIYEVRYFDREGNERAATCKTSLFTGVYFSEDRIIKRGQQRKVSRLSELEEENRRLREELERAQGRDV